MNMEKASFAYLLISGDLFLLARNKQQSPIHSVIA